MAEEWTSIVMRNGAQLHLPQAVSNVIAQIADPKHATLPLQWLQLRGGEFALVSIPDIVAIVLRVCAEKTLAARPPGQPDKA